VGVLSGLYDGVLIIKQLELSLHKLMLNFFETKLGNYDSAKAYRVMSQFLTVDDLDDPAYKDLSGFLKDKARLQVCLEAFLSSKGVSLKDETVQATIKKSYSPCRMAT